MMSPSEIRQWALRRYPEWLRSLVTDESFFPREVRFGKPSSTADFSVLKSAFEDLEGGTRQIGYRIEWEDRATKRWGLQRFPSRVWFEDERAFLHAIGKTSEADLFRFHLQMTRERCPELLPWLAINAIKMAEAGSDWPAVLSVAAYFLRCPKPGLYARQLPIAVPTKFIDQHHDILRQLLDHLLPGLVNASATTFNARYHLLEDEPPVRLRFLDDSFRRGCGCPVCDLTVPLSQFRALDICPEVAVVVENKMCFLTLPEVAGGVAIWGQGKAATLIHRSAWLHKVRLIYWGDMDDSGYSILSALRGEYRQVESMLMDDLAWYEHRSLAHSGKLDTSPPLEVSLSPAERHAWESVRLSGAMIEQEQIPTQAVNNALRQILSSLPASRSDS